MINEYSILMVKGKTIFSWFIRPLVNSKYSHCGLVHRYNNIFETDILYSSRLRTIRYNRNNYDLFVYMGLTREQMDGIDRFIESHIGMKYSLYEGLRLILHKWTGLETPDDLDRTNCIELLVDAFASVNIILTEERYPTFEDIISHPNIIMIHNGGEVRE